MQLASLQQGRIMNNRSVVEWPTGLTVYKPDKCWEGYTLFHADGNVYLVDMSGEIRHVWGGTSPDMKYLSGGHLLTGVGGRSAVSLTRYHTAAGCASTVAELNWEGEAVWKYDIEPGTELHHDLVRLENGNTLLLLRRWREAPAFWGEYYQPDKPWYVIPQEQQLERPVLDDFFREITPEGKTVWEWHSIDHLEELAVDDAVWRVFRRNSGDPLHTNTLEVLPDGNILTSFNKISTVAIIDRKSGGIKWTWGRGDNGTFSQHHPNRIPDGCPGEGNILIYDNGGINDRGKSRHYTRLVEVNPLTDEIEWEYLNLPHNWMRTHNAIGPSMMHHARRFFSQAWGSVQRLPNGNTLTLDAAANRLFEITYAGEIVWEYISPFMGSSVLPLVPGGIEPGDNPEGFPCRMPGVKFNMLNRDATQIPAERMPSYISFIYRCYRIPHEAVPL
jgi:hypothetical protein